MTSALQLVAAPSSVPRVDIARLRRETAQLSNLHGPGTAAVRSAARQLLVALELLQQQQRRQDAEVLRVEPEHSDAAADKAHLPPAREENCR